MRTLSHLCAAVALLALVGCGSFAPRPVPFAGPDSRLYLQRTVEFPAGVTRVYFQHGELVTARGLTLWDHHCALALDHAFEESLTVPPGEYVVADTQRRSTFGQWGYGVATYENSFLIAASGRPLYALYCEVWTLGESYDPRHHPDADTLADSLGDWLRLVPVGAPAN